VPERKMEAVRHSIFDNKIQLYRRPNSPFWWASCSVKGNQKRSSTEEESLAHAKDVARDWYLGLLGKYRSGELVEGKLFKVASAKFISEFETLTEGERSKVYVEGHRFRINRHLDRFFGEMPLPAITDSKIQEYRVHRMKTGMSRKDQARKSKLEKAGLRLQFRDVEIIDDADSGETILLIHLRGKRGEGICKSMPNAVRPFTRLRDRKRPSITETNAKISALPKQDDLLFPTSQHELLNAILEEEGLKLDREGRPRTAYSLRHTYICFRLLERADIYQVAKNCHTSVEMIQKYYASHLETDIDAGAVNVLRNKKYQFEDDEENRSRPGSKAKPTAKPTSPKRFGKKQY
jgi:integrase